MRPTAAAVFRTKSGSHQTPRWRKGASNRGSFPVSEWVFCRWNGNHEVGEEDDLMRRTSRGLTVRISFPPAVSLSPGQFHGGRREAPLSAPVGAWIGTGEPDEPATIRLSLRLFLC